VRIRGATEDQTGEMNEGETVVPYLQNTGRFESLIAALKPANFNFGTV
jgi:hypothetical protein